MDCYSTQDRTCTVSIGEAIISGMPPINTTTGLQGLWFPDFLPFFSKNWFTNLKSKTLPEIGFDVLLPFFKTTLTAQKLEEICHSAFNFPIPMIEVDTSVFALELFHGPTLAFKDVAARFMARILSELIQDSCRILVATSGDTGSAVAHGFFGVSGLSVVVLYPSGMVSPLQEKQLTTLGGNILALEVKGTFDDCQKMVKEALLDPEVQAQLRTTTANSINLGRLLPQMVYYMYAWKMVQDRGLQDKNWVVSVPSGNFGNLTAGLMARAMGLPFRQFLVANNLNRAVFNYLHTGRYQPGKTIRTLSNAMDVGVPSNFDRMVALFGAVLGIEPETNRNHANESIWKEMKRACLSSFIDDEETLAGIKNLYEKSGYILDPHGSVAFQALSREMAKLPEPCHGLFLETAHPAKFLDTVQSTISGDVPIPERLANCLEKEKKAVQIENSYSAFKTILMERPL